MKTKSEQIFEDFLNANEVPFEKIKVDATPRPDYLVSIGDSKLVFEIKELVEDKNFGVVDPIHRHIKTFSGTIGEHVRRSIAGAKSQIQYGAKQGIPSVLLIYNKIDRVFQNFGTSDEDFIAAMYGEYTIAIDRNSGEHSEMFNGKNQSLQQNKNTSFSGVGSLRDRGAKTHVKIFENIHAVVKIPFEQLPGCFEFQRVEVLTEPLSFNETE